MVLAAKETAGSAQRVAMLAGASGATGGALLQLLLREPGFARVLALSRRPLPLEHARLANRILRFEELASSLKGQRCTDAFCTLGAAGGPRATEAQLRAVDLQLVLDFARVALAAGASRLVVVSAAGAGPGAQHPFQRVKGEMEAGVRALGFTGLDILQPGLVYGARSSDGAGDTLRHGLMSLAGPLLRRSKGALHALGVREVAAAMVAAARSQRRGPCLYAGESLTALAAAGSRPA